MDSKEFQKFLLDAVQHSADILEGRTHTQEELLAGLQSFMREYTEGKGRGIALLIGGGSPVFGERIARHLDVEPVRIRTQKYSNGSIEPFILDSVRGKDVFIVQSGVRACIQDKEEAVAKVSQDLVELCLLIDAASDSAARVTAVCPYFFYTRSDKKDKPRIAIGSRLAMKMLHSAGAHRILTMELHSMQQQGFAPIPVDQLFGMNELLVPFIEMDFEAENTIVVAPDHSAAPACNLFAQKLREALERKLGRDLPMIEIVIIDKRRKDDSEKPSIVNIIGKDLVPGKRCIQYDDEGLTLNTLVNGSEALISAGADPDHQYTAITHGIYSSHAIEKLEASPIRMVIATDTVDLPSEIPSPKIRWVGVAQVFAEAIRRIHYGGSISDLCK